MDFITSFDIQLEKDVFYAGEALTGNVILENSENVKIRGIRAVLRGKAHAEWKIMKSGERRTVKDDQYLLDDKVVVWGKDKHDDDGAMCILPRGMHSFAFSFALPQSALPCSFESKAATIRYYIKVVIDIPYASPPQGVKYFTIIGPHIDCMEEKYLSPMVGVERKTNCCLCCKRGPLAMTVTLERSAYVCGESVRLRADVDNHTDLSCQLHISIAQMVEYFIDKGVLGENKVSERTVLEHRTRRIGAFSSAFHYDSTHEQPPIRLPVVPPTLIGVTRLVQIYYMLRVVLENEKNVTELQMEFPFTVATVPFRIPTQPSTPVDYGASTFVHKPEDKGSKIYSTTAADVCASHVEGGLYVSPEFQIGQVYDGTFVPDEDSILLYRPVYVRLTLPPTQSVPGGTDIGDRYSMRTGSDASHMQRTSSSMANNHVVKTPTSPPHQNTDLPSTSYAGCNGNNGVQKVSTPNQPTMNGNRATKSDHRSGDARDETVALLHTHKSQSIDEPDNQVQLKDCVVELHSSGEGKSGDVTKVTLL